MFREPTKYEIFLEVFEQWRKHFKLPPIETRKDNRYHCHACIQQWNMSDSYHQRGYIELVYNPRRLAKWPYYLLVCGALHELEHYKSSLPYDTFEQQIQSEYKAEQFALNIMKKYYPIEYRQAVWHVKNKNLNNNKWKKENPLYFQAFSKIKDYV
jgi:hypothetical protein